MVVEIMKELLGKKITFIVKVIHINGSTSQPLNIFFNVQDINGDESFFSVGINNDGETIFFNYQESSLTNHIIADDLYYGSIVNVEKGDELYKLMEQRILDVQFGNGFANIMNNDKTFIKKAVLYYFKVTTLNNTFLYFNCGDEGCYSFDNIDEILKNDIYGYSWEPTLPT